VVIRLRPQGHPSTALLPISTDSFANDGLTSLLANSFDDGFSYPRVQQRMMNFGEVILLIFPRHADLRIRSA
jgi:hypothetical protein